MNIHILNFYYGDYVVYVPINTHGNSTPLLNIVRVYRDNEWLKAMYPVLKQFWDGVVEKRTTMNA